jgi:hypothetical protein
LRICVKTVIPPRLPVSVSCSFWKAAPKYPLLNVKGDAALMVAGFPTALKIAFGDVSAPVEYPGVAPHCVESAATLYTSTFDQLNPAYPLASGVELKHPVLVEMSSKVTVWADMAAGAASARAPNATMAELLMERSVDPSMRCLSRTGWVAASEKIPTLRSRPSEGTSRAEQVPGLNPGLNAVSGRASRARAERAWAS